jgi:hypothetical protein
MRRRVEATVLEVNFVTGDESLRGGAPSRVRALTRAGCAALDSGRRSGWQPQLGVAGATRGLTPPVLTPTFRARPRAIGRLGRRGCFTLGMAASS